MFIGLHTLNLNENQIFQIEGLETLRNLRMLFLRKNKIAKVSGLEKLSNLHEIDLGDNNFSEKFFKNYQERNSYELDTRKLVDYCRKQIPKQQWNPDWR